MGTNVKEALAPLDGTLLIKRYKNNARTKPLCRIAKSSTESQFDSFCGKT